MAGTRPHKWWWVDGKLVAAIVVLAIGVAFAVIELCDEAVRKWTVAHPYTVALSAGLVVLVLTVLGVERVLALTDSRRWRQPARVAIDTYIFSADSATQRIYRQMRELLRSLPKPPAHDPVRMLDIIEQLSDQAPETLNALYKTIRSESDQLGPIAMTAGDTIVRHQPYRWVADDVFAIQKHLGDAALATNDLYHAIHLAGGPQSSRALEVRKGLQSAIVDHLQQVSDLLGTKYLQAREVGE